MQCRIIANHKQVWCTMSTKPRQTKRKAEGAAGGQSKLPKPEEAFVISCSRKSQLVDTDEHSYVDCYGDEVDAVDQEIGDAAEAGDGVWVYNYRQPQGTSNGHLLVFKTKEAANSHADTVWQQLYQDHPFDRVYREDDDDEGEEEDESDDGEDASAFRELKPDGCVLWRREQQYIVDPFGADLKNIVSSTLIVEVVPAKMMS